MQSKRSNGNSRGESFQGLWMKLRHCEEIRIKQDVPHAGQELDNKHRLIVVLDGKGSMETDDECQPVKEGDVWVLLPGQRCSFYIESFRQLSLHVFAFDAYREQEGEDDETITLRRAIWPLAGRMACTAPSSMFTRCRAMEDAWQQADERSRFRAQAWFQELMYELAVRADSAPVEDSLETLEQTRLYLDNHYQESWTIEKLAAMAGLSPYYYMHLFKKTYGKSAMDYVNQLRINKAKQLMGEGRERVREIARQVGFSDEYYFSRKFKQQQGVAPTVYMKSRRHRVATYHTAITGQLLALQTIPGAAPLDPKWSAYYRQKYAIDIPVHLRDPFVAENWAVNREAIRDFSPDLIITSDYLDQTVKQELGHMANALFIPWKEKDWRVHLQMIGEYLGRDKEAEQWLLAYDKKSAAARETLRRAIGDDSLLMLYVNQPTLYACGSQRTGSVLYSDLQLRPVAQVESLFAYEQITLDELCHYHADRLIVIVKKDQPSRDFWSELQKTEQWFSLKAVQNRHVYEVTPDPWLEYSAIGHERIMEESLRLFAQYHPN
ncbi:MULTISPECIES: AraC family transcriptional regulator [Brevibacillus]|uniref:AraC family transcriptional regulator n=1 Tax=Brevibacillus TaxID=55080 RepID=UPI000ED23EAF|nr:AraC family transcriptional regulator [Brevibacillus sp.]HBZ82722.1 AraC family transcriptional regulator [Brevibacillus sp.]